MDQEAVRGENERYPEIMPIVAYLRQLNQVAAAKTR